MKVKFFVKFLFMYFVTFFLMQKSYSFTCPPNIDTTLDCYVFTQISSPSYPSSYVKIGEEHSQGITKLSYQLISQQWPYQNMPPVSPNVWQHNIDIYIPDVSKSKTAFLYIGADIHSLENIPNVVTNKNGALLDVDFAEIALESQMVVVTLSDIPNQPLNFYPFPFKLAEDFLVAHSWKLFLNEPQTNEFLPVHLAMVFATIKTMDLVQEEMKDIGQDINSFILSGASKRGWTAWLTNIADTRVTAFIPIVFDLLNMEENTKRSSLAYGGNWPIAFLPYYTEHISKYLGTEQFKDLVKIQDPLSYLKTSKAKRLEVEKYMINASGDDFFLPDNSLTYYSKLPGDQNTLRFVPNSGHAIDAERIIESSLIPFLKRYSNNKKLPIIQWEINDNINTKKQHNLKIKFNEKPESITAWLALNPTDRDFRYACNIRYLGNPISVPRKNEFTYSLLEPEKGWNALLFELQFQDGLVATTPVFIFPEDVYPSMPPVTKSLQCSTLPPI